jgi:uncharacterized membrane protein
VEFTIDELTALVLQHSRLAMQSRKAADELIKTADEYDKLAQVYLEAGKRFRREVEEKESKMNIRKIITNTSLVLLTIMALVIVLYAMPFALTKVIAQDAPLVTNTPAVTAAINGQPVEATLEPVSTPSPVENTSSLLSILLDKLGMFALIGAVIVLAFKTSGLIPADTVDKVLARGFDLAKGLADTTPTPVDNQLIDIVQPIISKLIADELAKRDAGTVTPIPLQTTTTVSVPPMTYTDLTPKV